MGGSNGEGRSYETGKRFGTREAFQWVQGGLCLSAQQQVIGQELKHWFQGCARGRIDSELSKVK